MNKQFYKATSLKYGTTDIVKVMLGPKLVWPASGPATHTFVWPVGGLSVTRNYLGVGPVDQVRIGDIIVIDLRSIIPREEGLTLSESGNIGSNQQNQPHQDAIAAGWLQQTGGPAPIIKQVSIDYGSQTWPMQFFEGGQIYTFKVVKGWPQSAISGLAAWYAVNGGSGTYDTDSGTYIIQLFQTIA